MATEIPGFTPLPTPPNRNDSPSNFESRADAFLGSLPDFGTEGNAFASAANTLASELEIIESNVIGYEDLAEDWASKLDVVVDSTDYSAKEYAIGDTAPSAKQYANADEDIEVETGKYSAKHFSLKAEQYSNIAQSLANFIGEWSAQTGSVSIPTSVYHEGFFWSLIQNLSDITTQEPTDVSSFWVKVSSGANEGAEIKSISSDLELTAVNKLIQDITTTNDNLNVSLPNATTIKKGISYVFYNSGLFTYSIRDNSGTLLTFLNPNESCLVSCTNNDTSSGSFKVSSFLETQKGFFSSIPYTFSAFATLYIDSDYISENKSIVCFRDTGDGNVGKALIVDSSTGIPDFNAIVTFSGVNAASNIAVARISDTKAIVCYKDDDNNNYLTTCILNISGNAITAGTPQVLHSYLTSALDVTGLTEAKALVCFSDTNQSSYGKTAVLSISGDTISMGSLRSFESAAVSYISVDRISDTKAVVCYSDDGNSYSGTRALLTISSTSVSSGTPFVFSATFCQGIKVKAFNTDYAIVCYKKYYLDTLEYVAVLDLSEEKVFSETLVSQDEVSSASSIAVLNENKCLVCFSYPSGGIYGVVIKREGITIQNSSQQKINDSISGYYSVNKTNTSNFLLNYAGESNYGMSKALEII